MAQRTVIVYGPGGYDPAKPNNNRLSDEQVAVADPLAAEANAETLRARAQQALTANATYLALASPSAAQNTAQVQRLTREANALLRVFLGALDNIADTA